MVLGCNVRLTAKANQAMFKELTLNISECFPVRRKKNKWREGGREGEIRSRIQTFNAINISIFPR